jgi:predicted phage tail protein
VQEVRAVNGVGESQPVSAAINLPDRPTPPTLRSVVVDVSTAVVEWAPPVSHGGQPILSYLAFATESGIRSAAVVSASDGAQCATVTTTCQIDNLDPTKKYIFTVRAVNTVGESDSSAPLDPFTVQPDGTTPPSTPDATLPRTGKGRAEDVALKAWWLLLMGFGVAFTFRRYRRR